MNSTITQFLSTLAQNDIFMLHYKIMGEGKVVVLLHGYLENISMWKDFSEDLAKQYKVVLVDLPGHGQSAIYRETHSMEFMAEKLKEVLDSLQIKEAALIGHSMGAYVALAFIEQYKKMVNGILLINSTTLADSDEKKEQRLKVIEVAQTNKDTLINLSIPALFMPKNIETLKEQIEVAKTVARATPIEGITAALRGMRLRADRTNVLEDLDKPISFIIGKHDQTTNPQELLKVIPTKDNIEVFQLEVAHMAHLEMPEECLRIMKGFLEKAFDFRLKQFSA